MCGIAGMAGREANKEWAEPMGSNPKTYLAEHSTKGTPPQGKRTTDEGRRTARCIPVEINHRNIQKVRKPEGESISWISLLSHSYRS